LHAGKQVAAAAAAIFLTQLQTRQDSFVLSGPSFDDFCLVSTQFPNEVTLCRQVIGLIKFSVTDLKHVLSPLSQLHSVSRVEPGWAVFRRQRRYSCKLETGSRRDKTHETIDVKMFKNKKRSKKVAKILKNV